MTERHARPRQDASPARRRQTSLSIVLKGYPRLSETFIAQELLGLQERGIDFEIVSLRHPTDVTRHPVHDKIKAPLRYLPEYLYLEPLRVLRAWWRIRRLPQYRRARARWLADLKRDFTPNRIRRFGQALVLAVEMPAETSWIHVHFLHTPASVACYAAILRDLPWSCSAHAKDIWTSPAWEKSSKLENMSWLVTCTKTNAAHLKSIAGSNADKVSLVYHGLDLTRFTPTGKKPSERDGRDTSDPVIILSVGRAVEKKGFDILLRALARLDCELNWRFVHIGGGSLLDKLRRTADKLGIKNRVEFLGARSQQDVLAQLVRADIFALTCRIAGDGDRDGLPNVLMEAQAVGVACLSTDVSAIPELIVDGETGLLVGPGRIDDTAAALTRLIADPSLRSRLGQAGQRRMRSSFSHLKGIDEIAARFRRHGSEDRSQDTLLSDA